MTVQLRAQDSAEETDRKVSGWPPNLPVSRLYRASSTEDSTDSSTDSAESSSDDFRGLAASSRRAVSSRHKAERREVILKAGSLAVLAGLGWWSEVAWLEQGEGARAARGVASGRVSWRPEPQVNSGGCGYVNMMWLGKTIRNTIVVQKHKNVLPSWHLI